ncbi:MAG: InlB B-repeat-containing protein, partial [Solirubrobacteraceae bacterium]
AGNLLIADYGDDVVWLVAVSRCASDCAYGLDSMSADDIYTVAGDGSGGFAGDGGAATAAELSSPSEVAVDGAGDLLIADAGNARVREVSGPAERTLSVAVSGSGSVSSSPAGVSCPGSCAAQFANASTVTLTETPAAGWQFAGWSGGGCAGTAVGCSVPVGAQTAVTATFTAIPDETLSVSRAGPGSGSVSSSPAGITCPGACSAAFEQGTAVTLTETAATGSLFAGWTGGGCSGTASTCEVTIGGAESVTATFDPEPITVTVSSGQLRRLLRKLLVPTGRAAGLRAILKAGGYRYSASAPEAGRLVIDWYERVGRRDVLVASATLKSSRAGHARFMLRLSARGRALLKHARRVRIEATASFTPSHLLRGVSESRTFTLRR